MEIRASKSHKSDPSKSSPKPSASQPPRSQVEQYYDRSDDMVARVHRTKEAARREMEAFGDVSEYDIVILQGQLKENKPQPEADPDAGSQS
ncbi:MAG: hypothetical protein WA634_16915 [Silvibacterium sp.]